MNSRAPSSPSSDADKTFARLTTAPVAPLIIRLGVPTMMSMLVTALYNTAAAFYVASLGTSAIAALGIVFSLQMFIQALGIMVGQGCASMTSRLLGAKDYDRVNRLASTGLLTVGVIAVTFSLIALLFLTPFLRLIGATETILPYAWDYAIVILIGAPVMAAAFTLNNLLRSEGLAFVGMIGLGAGGILNILVTPIFIFVFDWGMSGAAWATVVCQFISFVILLSHYWRGHGSIHLSVRLVDFDLHTHALILKNGIPSMTRNACATVAACLLNVVAAGFGDAAVAAMSVVGRVMMTSNALLIGLGQGFQPVLGYNWGAGLFVRVKESLDATLKMGYVIMISGGVVGFIFAADIVHFFAVGDSEVMDVGVLALQLQCLASVIMPLNIIGNMAYQVLGRAGIATLLAASRQGLFFLPLAIILPYSFGIEGLQAVPAASEVLASLVCGYYLYKLRCEFVVRARGGNIPKSPMANR